MPNKNTISSTSQNFLDIHDIANNIIILKNGSTSVVLTVNAMNFGLLAEQEQDAVIYAYAGLLNSLNFPIQILIQSQTKDVSAYLKLLEKRKKETTDEIKKAWIRSYSQFVGDLIQERNVLDKKFFVVIPASSLEMGLTLAQNLVSGFKEQTIEGVEKSVILEKAQSLLEPKRDHIIAQFNRIGLLARQLTTQEIIKLFYTNYNPETTEGQQITNSSSYTTALVQAQIRGDFMNNQLSQNQVNPTQATASDNSESNDIVPAPTTPIPAVPAQPVVQQNVQQNNQQAAQSVIQPDEKVEKSSLAESPIIQPPTDMTTPPTDVTTPPTNMTTPPTDVTTPSPTPPAVTPVAPIPSPTEPTSAQIIPPVAPTPPTTNEATSTTADSTAQTSIEMMAKTAIPPVTPAGADKTLGDRVNKATQQVEKAAQTDINNTLEEMTQKPKV